MDIRYLLTDFDGRIARKSFWIGIVALIVAAIIVSIVLSMVFSPLLAQLVTTLALLYPAGAIYAKRLHDRNKPTMPWLAIYFGPGLLMSLMQFLGIGFQTISVNDQTMSTPTGGLGWLIIAATMVIGIWALIELGFLKGTQGGNDFGPDPLD